MLTQTVKISFDDIVKKTFNGIIGACACVTNQPKQSW